MEFQERLKALLNGEILSSQVSEELMLQIASGEIDPILIASFLSVFKLRPVTANELRGFRSALLKISTTVDLSDQQAIDICGTGGDGKGSFNISTLSAFVVAACGVKVAKHGNYGSSSACGSSNILEALSVKLPRDEEGVRRQIQESGVAYMHAPYFHPALKNVAQVRKTLGVPTVFNLLGPLVNPSKPRGQLIGVMNKNTAELYRETLKGVGLDFTILHSTDGYDEVSLTSDLLCCDADQSSYFTLSQLGFPKIDRSELKAPASLPENTKLFIDILSGRSSEAKIDLIAANSAFGLKVGRGGGELREYFNEAKQVLLSGAGLQTFNRFLESSR